jgi:hypothetical protein
MPFIFPYRAMEMYCKAAGFLVIVLSRAWWAATPAMSSTALPCKYGFSLLGRSPSRSITTMMAASGSSSRDSSRTAAR